MIGTRSAVFAPLAELGLIVVDEEHDASYKQQEGGCRYSARDLAVRRAQQAAIPVVLGSATPAFESLHNVRLGRYRSLPLPRRADQAAAPHLALIDLRAHAVHAGLAGPVTQAIDRHLRSDGQVLVYLNRRGYAPTLLCTNCGWIAPCTQCDARLTVHRLAAQLRCHYCGAAQPLPERCGALRVRGARRSARAPSASPRRSRRCFRMRRWCDSIATARAMRRTSAR